MDFSDIRTIIIGEAGEYGKRLVRYLEIHLSSAVRVYHFTTAEGMVSFKEEAEIYLLDSNTSNVKYYRQIGDEMLSRETKQMRDAMDDVLRNIIGDWNDW